jgi:hypothetical protein
VNGTGRSSHVVAGWSSEIASAAAVVAGATVGVVTEGVGDGVVEGGTDGVVGGVADAVGDVVAGGLSSAATAEAPAGASPPIIAARATVEPSTAARVTLPVLSLPEPDGSATCLEAASEKKGHTRPRD